MSLGESDRALRERPRRVGSALDLHLDNLERLGSRVRKADMSISRFTEFVEALGGRWQISVRFGEGQEYSARSLG